MVNNYDYSYINNYNELKALQNILLEIIETVDSFCREHYIKYSLCGGSMLGAVRHGGFIPWDDDIDIIMLREDYERFIKEWLLNPPQGYLLQNKDINAPDIDVSFVKIRKNHTTFLQKESDRGRFHTGIFIDIFPFDRLPQGLVNRYLFYWRCLKYQLYTREFVPENAQILVRLISRILLLSNNKRRRHYKRMSLLKKITKYNNNHSLPLVAIETIKSITINYSPNMMDNLELIRFEDKEFFCFSNRKEYLEKFYGDYMTLPPVEERNWSHRPLILDFTHNIEELE